MNPLTGEGYRCAVCDQPFTVEEWEDRHNGRNGEEYHADCCPECIEEEEEGTEE